MHSIKLIKFQNSVYNQYEMNDFVESFIPCQENEQYNDERNILRGLHYQKEPFAQSKLLRVVEGKILSVAIDIRYYSNDFGSCTSLILDDVEKKQMYIPKGYAHGYITLSKKSICIFKVDEYFRLDSMKGIYFGDKDLNIDWGIKLNDIIISAKDSKNLSFKDVQKYKGKI